MDTLDKIMLLIKEHKIEQQDLAEFLGINKQTISDWKSRKSNSYLRYMQKIAGYFNVPIKFFTDAPPFDLWDEINANRKALVHYMYLPQSIYDSFFENKQDIDLWSVSDFSNFVDSTIEEVRLTEDGDFDVTLKDWIKAAKTKNNTSTNLNDNSKWLEENASPLGTIVYLPVLGRVAAGNGVIAHDEIIGHEFVSADKICSGETYFWLHVKGDSMSPKIEDGDLVLIKKQSSVDSGSYAVVIVDGEDGVVKKVNYGPDWIELVSTNPYYPARRFEGSDVLRITVIGKVIEVRRVL
ncbi:MAG: helix-turn-helix domain-containing protein [Bacteroidales bacterium]|nr:helix-turn-helix domain-containing protein [Bacteroidales bacterium]